jgi:hypothetical protein
MQIFRSFKGFWPGELYSVESTVVCTENALLCALNVSDVIFKFSQQYRENLQGILGKVAKRTPTKDAANISDDNQADLKKIWGIENKRDAKKACHSSHGKRIPTTKTTSAESQPSDCNAETKYSKSG